MQNPEQQNTGPELSPDQQRKAEALVQKIKEGQGYNAELDSVNLTLVRSDQKTAESIASVVQKGLGAGNHVSILPNWIEGKSVPSGFKMEIGTEVQKKWNQIIGTSIPNNEQWDKKSLDERLKYLQNQYESGDGKGSSFTLQDMYGFEANVDSIQAAQIATKFSESLQKGEKIADKEKWKNLMIEAQLRVTHREAYADALEQYDRLFARYERLKAECRQIGMEEKDILDVGLDGTAQAHYAKVLDAGKRRRDLTLQIWQKNGKDNETGGFKYDIAQLQQLDKIDTEIWELLKSDKEEGGFPPVHNAMVQLLQKRYTFLVGRVDGQVDEAAGNKLAPEKVREIRARVYANNEKILTEIEKRSKANLLDDILGKKVVIDEEQMKALRADPARILTPSNDDTKKLYESIAKETLGEEEYKRFIADVTALQTKEKISATLFKRLGSQHVDEIVQLHGELIQYQTKRARLTTVRHHFQQAYGLDTKNPPTDGKPNIEALKNFAKDNQNASLDAIDKHLDYVQNNVLKRGILVTLEDFHNKEVRYYFTHMAMLLTDLETMWMPQAPDTSDGEWSGPLKYVQKVITMPRNQAREALVGEIPKLMGWPKYSSGPRVGQWKDISDLTTSEKAAMKAKQTSVLDALKGFEKSGVQTELRASVSTLREVTKDISPEELLSLNVINPEDVEAARNKIPKGVDINTPEGRKTALEVMAKDVGETQAKRLLVLIALENLDDSAVKYNKEYAKMMHDFHKVVGDHVDWEAAAMEFAGGQGALLLLWLLLPAGAVALRAYLKRRSRMKKERKAQSETESARQGERQARTDLDAALEQSIKAYNFAKTQLETRVGDALQLEGEQAANVDFKALHAEWKALKAQIVDAKLDAEVVLDATLEVKLEAKVGK